MSLQQIAIEGPQTLLAQIFPLIGKMMCGASHLNIAFDIGMLTHEIDVKAPIDGFILIALHHALWVTARGHRLHKAFPADHAAQPTHRDMLMLQGVVVPYKV